MRNELRKPNMLEFTKDLAVAVADYYEYSMANANLIEGIRGKDTVFDFVVRKLPTNKVVGNFTFDGVKYDKLEQRDYLVNAGLEQAASYFLEAKGNEKIRNYLENIMGVNDNDYLNFVENIEFKGDLYAMPEGTIFFGQESQIRVHERFEEAQIYESLLLNTVNPQTNVATTANDISEIVEGKVLLEGGSRRGQSPQAALFNSRAARIGGFTFSSHVAYGMEYGEKVGGTHGHSYVMLHPSEYDAFKAQVDTFGDGVCFLLDTYNVENALKMSVDIAKKENLNHFAFRIDSGDLGAQAKMIHERMNNYGFAKNDYTIVASDDLNAGKIRKLEDDNVGIDKYLVGTFVVNPPKPVPGVYKLAAYKDDHDTDWTLRGKLAEDPTKGTLPGVKQVYRVTGEDGFYKKDIIAFEGENLESYVEKKDTIEALLVPIIKDGKQIYDFPTIDEISKRRVDQLTKFKDIKNYDVVISDLVRETQMDIKQKYGFAKL
jgi:nicotinate phosphoribosyltransferase